jgi:hypothetical protein
MKATIERVTDQESNEATDAIFFGRGQLAQSTQQIRLYGEVRTLTGGSLNFI